MFYYTYYPKVGGHFVAEMECRVNVGHENNVEIFIQTIGEDSNKWIPAERFSAEIENDIRKRDPGLILDDLEEAIRGRDTYFQEMASIVRPGVGGV